METFSNMLVAIDLSKNCRPALEKAMSMKNETEADLTCLFVVPDSGGEYSAFDSVYKKDISRKKLLENYVLPRATDWLDRQELDLNERPDLVARVGKPPEQIIEYAKKEGNDLILMGTHGRSGLQRMWLGSVAERVVRMAPCPVMIVRSQPGTKDDPDIMPEKGKI